MDYSETLDWLFSQLPMYQRTGGAHYKINLDKTLKLMDLLGNPERSFKSIHVAGTNGKGSVSHMISSVLQEADYKTGLYTSPHLLDFRERVKINGREIDRDYVIDFVAQHKDSFVDLELSFFEMTVGLAFDYFRSQKVDVAVVETGMGGRLDSTNVIQPIVSIITNIGFDHQQFLGETLKEIAGEKAGIIKSNAPVIIGETQSSIKHVFEEKAREMSTPIFFADDELVHGHATDLKGHYQKKNSRTAEVALKIVSETLPLDSYHIAEGLLSVMRNTGLRGRWETLSNEPLVICDTAHNVEGIREAMQQLVQIRGNQLHIVWGMVSDKNAEEYLKLLPKDSKFYFTEPSIPRKMPFEELVTKAQSLSLSGEGYPSVEIAYKNAIEAASDKDTIFVGGSTFVVADLLALFE